MIELENLQQELRALSKIERLKLAHWLLDSLVETSGRELPLAEMNAQGTADNGPLSEWVGIFSGGPGNTAERDEEILEAEIDKMTGWGHP